MARKPLKDALYETVHRSKKPPKQLADETGISYNYMMRAAMDTESGCDFNLKYVVPLMLASDNYEILKSQAALCGFLLVKNPTGTRKGAKRDLQDYQVSFNQMIVKLIRYMQDPSEDLCKEINDLLRQHMSDTENIRRRFKKNLMNQKELF